MKVTPAGTCRADGKIYTRLAAYDVPATDTLDISAQAKDGRSIPAKIYETINAKPKGSERIFVAVPPVLNVKGDSYTIGQRSNPASKVTTPFSFTKAKWESRINYRTNRQQRPRSPKTS